MASKQERIVKLYFTSSTGNSTSAKCMLCDAEILSSQNSSNLLKHLRDRHRLETTSHLWKNDDHTATVSQTRPCPMEAELSGDEDTAAASIVKMLHESDIEIADDQRVVSRQTLAAKRRSPTAKKLTSIVWNCFRKGEAGSDQAACTICGITIRLTCSTTSNLLKHITSKHPVDYKAMVLNKYVTAPSKSKQQPINIKSLMSSQINRRRSRSIIWKYFAKCASDHSQVLCTFCGRLLKQRNGSTSNLIKHLFAVHQSKYRQLFPKGSHEKSEECIEDMKNESYEDGLFIGRKQAERKILDGTQMKLSEKDCELNLPLCDLEGENEISNTNAEPMFVRIQPVWQKFCDERESEFNKFMNTKQKEVEETRKSMQKLQQQFNFLVDEVEQYESKRKAELDRQEEMEAQLLLNKEAMQRKWKYRMAYINACNLMEDTINGELSTTDQNNRIVDGVTDDSNLIEVSPNFVNGD